MSTCRRRLTLILAVAGLAVLATTVVGLYGLVRGPSRSPIPVPSSSDVGGRVAPIAPIPSGRGSTGHAPASLPHTDNPTTYARAVATALFDWDTTSGYLPADYTAPVLADADPSGEETAGLIGDVAGYEPTTTEWARLATMQVAQRLQIIAATLPSSWPEALAQARGQLRPGTTAITITGLRHRTGIWDGHHASTTGTVSFTIFLACRPAFPRCHTLRLSQLDNPLK